MNMCESPVANKKKRLQMSMFCISTRYFSKFTNLKHLGRQAVYLNFKNAYILGF